MMKLGSEEVCSILDDNSKDPISIVYKLIPTPKLEDDEDLPSVLGHFTWTVIGDTCIPCLLNADTSKYVALRIVESKVLSKLLTYLDSELLDCVNVDIYELSEAKINLLNEINFQHCETAFGKKCFTKNDYLMKLDDCIEFYQFLNSCYKKLTDDIPAESKSRCGFIRIDDNSVIPYTDVNNRQYVPLFYFEGQVESLKTKAINVEKWDLAYLKFCCKLQGIKSELFASDKCQVISIEDLKFSLPDGCRIEKYWPSDLIHGKNLNRKRKHVYSQVPSTASSSTAVKQLQPASEKSLNSDTEQSSSIQLPQSSSKQSSSIINCTKVKKNLNIIIPRNQDSTSNLNARVIHKIIPFKKSPELLRQLISSEASIKPIKKSYAERQRAYRQRLKERQKQSKEPAKTNAEDFENHEDGLKEKLHSLLTTNYSDSSTKSNGKSSLLNYHLINSSNSSSISSTTKKLTNNISETLPQWNVSNSKDFSSFLDDRNGNNTVNGSRYYNDRVNNVRDAIDLSSSPPNSSASTNYVSNGVFQVPEYRGQATSSAFRLKHLFVKNQEVTAINLKPEDLTLLAVTLYDVYRKYFTRMSPKMLREALTKALKCNLYRPNSVQTELLGQVFKDRLNCNDLLLIKLSDFIKFHRHLTFIHSKHQNSSEGDSNEIAKRKKFSNNRTFTNTDDNCL